MLRTHLKSQPRVPRFPSSHVEALITKDLLSVLKVGIPVHKIHISALLKVKSSLETAARADKKKGTVTKESAYTVFLF